MFQLGKVVLTSLIGLALAGSMTARAEQAFWRVSKTSGEVFITNSSAQPVALSDNESVSPGDVVRTGRNGRVLLSRGEETILVSPNSQVEIARDSRAGFSTILQKAGSILLEVEKRNVQHFEVNTPFLAAVVKGTKFRVTVEEGASNVEVIRGQVEVRDYRSGQIAIVNPDQTAAVTARGPSGIAVTGAGAFSPIQQGVPGAAPSQLNGSPAVPERRAETAGQAPRPRVVSSPPSADNVVAGAGEASGASTRQPNTARTSTDKISGGSGGKALGAADDGASDGMFSAMVKWVSKSVAAGGAKNLDENATVVIAIPAAFGTLVAAGVGIVRRRKRTKSDEDRR